MNSNITRHLLIVRLAAILLLTICAIQSNIRAQEPANNIGGGSTQATPSQDGNAEGINLKLYFSPTGLIRGETLRVTWANLNDEDPDKRLIEPLRLAVRLFDANGRIIMQREAQAVSAGKFQSFDFNRDTIYLPGEAGTGRLQIRCEVEVIGKTKYPDLVLKQGFALLPLASLEIVGNTGATQSATRTERLAVCRSIGTCTFFNL